MLSINSVTVDSRSCRRRLPIWISLMGTIIGPLRREVAAPMENGRLRGRLEDRGLARRTDAGARQCHPRARGDTQSRRAAHRRDAEFCIYARRRADAAGAVGLALEGILGL